MKTKTQHTPGPWTNAGQGMENGFEIEPSGDEKFILATVWYHEDSDPEDTSVRTAQANARLIAAAPELLAALRGALNVLQNVRFDFGPHDAIRLAAIDDARDAIAKAEGE